MVFEVRRCRPTCVDVPILVVAPHMHYVGVDAKF
jgi:hypothetical protein